MIELPAHSVIRISKTPAGAGKYVGICCTIGVIRIIEMPAGAGSSSPVAMINLL